MPPNSYVRGPASFRGDHFIAARFEVLLDIYKAFDVLSQTRKKLLGSSDAVILSAPR